MLIDVSVKLESGMVFRKGSPPLIIKTVTCYDQDEGQYNTTFLSTAVHVGTHIDIMDQSKSIEITRFTGRGILIDVSGIQDRPVKLKDFEHRVAEIAENDFVFFRTGWEQYLGTERYFDHPELAFEVIEWLVSKKVNMVGIDALGLGRNKNHGLYDKYLADNNVFAVENLVNLDQIGDREFKVYCFPISIAGIEAVPARIAVEV